jgi:hypothetical protein
MKRSNTPNFRETQPKSKNEEKNPSDTSTKNMLRYTLIFIIYGIVVQALYQHITFAPLTASNYRKIATSNSFALFSKKRKSRLIQKPNQPSQTDSLESDDIFHSIGDSNSKKDSNESNNYNFPNKPNMKSIEEELRQDIRQMKGKEETFFRDVSISQDVDSNSVFQMKSISDIFTFILVADFFVILGFLGWFAVGAETQSVSPIILSSFRSIFQPVVVPALTVLMVGSIASGITNKVNEMKSDQKKGI